MKQSINPIMYALVLALFLLTSTVVAGDEASAWRKTSASKKVRAYDLYAATYPNGSHAGEAIAKAVAMSTQGLEKAAGSCSADYPAMAYYAYASKAGPKVTDQVLLNSIDQAVKCRFHSAMKAAERLRAVDGLAAVRESLMPKSGQGLMNRGVVNLGFILIVIEQKVFQDVAEELYRCKQGNDPFRDPDPKEVYACGLTPKKNQSRVARSMATRMSSDFEIIGAISDPGFRAGFWEFYRKESKKDIVQEIASYFKLYDAAMSAKNSESDPKIAGKIESVAMLLAGGGKPTGGGFR